MAPKKRPKKEPKKVYDYSGLEKGMRVQAESEGVYYAAEVIMVSESKNRAKAPVKISYKGCVGCHEWVAGDRLRSKALAAEVAKEERNGKGDRAFPPSLMHQECMQLRAELKSEMAEQKQRLREEMQAELRKQVQQIRLEHSTKLQAELEVIRAEMGVLYHSLDSLRSLVESRAGAVGELEARIHSHHQHQCEEFRGELASVHRTIAHLARGSTTKPAEEDAAAGTLVLSLSMAWLSMSALARACAASRGTAAQADPCWKPFALQLFPELQLRQEDANWRVCLLRKRAVPQETASSIHQALIDRGENIWKFKNQWFMCECGLPYFIGECARAMELSRCNECGRPIGGRDHVVTPHNSGIENLPKEQADALFASRRTAISNIQVNVRQLSGDVLAVVHAPRDCTVREAKWRIYWQLSISVFKQSLVAGTSVLDDDAVVGACTEEGEVFDVMLVLSS